MQARDEVINVLRADKIDLALLEAKYGFVTPQTVLKALQRDAVQNKNSVWQEDIYEKPITEVTHNTRQHTHTRAVSRVLRVLSAFFCVSWTDWWRNSVKHTDACWNNC